MSARPPDLLSGQVAHPAPVITEENRYRLPLGVGDDGEVVSWALRDEHRPNLLLCGPAGSGKTNAVTGVVMEAAARAWPVWICEPRTREHTALRGWPNVQIVADTIEDTMAVIVQAYIEMTRRRDLFVRGISHNIEPLLLVLDSYSDLITMAEEWWVANTPAHGRGPWLLPAMLELLFSGGFRVEGLNVVMSNQRPPPFPDELQLQENFTSVGMGRLSPQAAMMLWNTTASGTSLTGGIPGGSAIYGKRHKPFGAPVEFQAFWIQPPPSESTRYGLRGAELRRKLRPSTVTHPPLEVQWPDPCTTGRTHTAWTALWSATLRRSGLSAHAMRDELESWAARSEDRDEARTARRAIEDN